MFITVCVCVCSGAKPKRAMPLPAREMAPASSFPVGFRESRAGPPAITACSHDLVQW
jgi:hypothetical protein